MPHSLRSFSQPKQIVIIGLMVLILFSRGAFADESPLETAYEHRQKGRYAEALETIRSLPEADQNTPAAALELSWSQQNLGEWKELTEQLEATVKRVPKNADLLARYAEVLFLQGKYELAQKNLQQALAINQDHPRAHWVQAQLFRETGQLEKALEQSVWFVRYYNRQQPEDAETLELVAHGALQYARWKGSTQILKFVLNTLCPDILNADELRWQAHAIAGELLLEKYNRAQAIPELKRGLAKNPRAVPILVSLANAAYQSLDLEEAKEYVDRALDIDPTNIAVCCLKADLAISLGRFSLAEDFLDKASAVNSFHQQILARRAAILLLEQTPESQSLKNAVANILMKQDVTETSLKPFAQLVRTLLERNSHPGEFWTALAETLESRRKYDLAEICYTQAIETMPQLSTPKTALGMLYMRIGETGKAQELLDQAFDADPFHVRVSNMRKVLKLLDGYETISTDHFVIRVDSQLDRVLGQYMSDYLESIYPELTKQFGYEPPHRTHFEIYHNAKGLSAHQWFSARMVGLPWIQTIGASTGVIVALASPTAAEEPFNWARVLKHEFVHVITLQQTRFNIPHWFTEALAVTAEGGLPPESWNDLLLERVPKGKLRSLDELNQGFTRPESPADWQFAYCQSRLYAKYMIDNYGKETIPKMLEAYRKNQSTKEAIPIVFGVDVETFEKGYRKFLDDYVTEIQGGVPSTPQKTLAEWERDYQQNPKSPKIAGHYARALIQIRKFDEAKTLAETALQKDPQEPNAALALATVSIRERDASKAAKTLQDALTTPPHPEVLELLARLKLAEKDTESAGKYYKLGQKHFPHSSRWLKGQAAVALRLNDRSQLIEALKQLVERETDNATYAKKLAELALEDENYEEVATYCQRALHVDVMDAKTHELLGLACEKLDQYSQAKREYEVTLQLAPKTIAAELGLARCLIHEKKHDEAREILIQLLEREPDHPEALSLKKQLPNN